MVFQVPIPEPLRWLEPSETETRTMHALAEYGGMHVKLYEDIAQHGHIATTYDYPVIVTTAKHDAAVADPEVRQPKLDNSPALMLFSAAARSGLAPGANLNTESTSSPRRGEVVERRDLVARARFLRRDRSRRAGAPLRLLDTEYCNDRQAACFRKGATA